jgi:hypothetical protein
MVRRLVEAVTLKQVARLQLQKLTSVGAQAEDDGHLHATVHTPQMRTEWVSAGLLAANGCLASHMKPLTSTGTRAVGTQARAAHLCKEDVGDCKLVVAKEGALRERRVGIHAKVELLWCGRVKCTS